MNANERHGYAALCQNIIRVDCREHLIEPSDNLRSEQVMHVVAQHAGNALSNAKLMSTIAALSYSTLKSFPARKHYIMSGIIQVTVCKCVLALVPNLS